MNSSIKNGLLMLAPCLLLVGVGVLLRNRKPAVLTVVQTGPFKVFVRQVRAVPIDPSEVQDGYDTKLEVELDATGKAPLWWQQGFGGYMGSTTGQLVTQGQMGATKVGESPFCWHPHLDGDSKKWVSTYLLKLAPIDGKVGDIRLRDRIQIITNMSRTLGPALWFDYKVRARGVSTKVPNVSRDPHLKVFRWVLDEAPPVENGGKPYQRLRFWFDKVNPPQGSDRYGVSTSLDIYDFKGGKTSLNGTITSGSDSLDDIGYFGAGYPNNSQPRPERSYIVHEFTMPAGLKHPLSIRGEAKFGPNWPLWINIPLTDAKGQLRLSPQPKPAFKVGGTSVRTATQQETAVYGCDTVAAFDLIPLNPKQDVSTWRWNGHYSQRIVPAKGPSIWKFPSKNGNQAAQLDYEALPGKMQIRYYLTLASIPASAGNLTLVAGISGNKSTYLPVKVMVRSKAPTSGTGVGATPAAQATALPTVPSP